MNNDLFEAIILQLSHYGSGTPQRFTEIYEKTFNYFGKESIAQDSFTKFVYFDFLNSIGTIETFLQNEKQHWAFLGQKFSYRSGGKTFTLGLSSTETTRFCNYEKNVFPTAGVDSEANYDSILFAEKMEKMHASWKEIIASSTQVGHVGEDVSQLEFFDFAKRAWFDKKDLLLNNGLYRSNRLQYRKTYYVISESKKYKLNDSELVYLIATALLNIPLSSLFIISDTTLTIPWKIRIPSLLKRLLTSKSIELRYKSDGITMQFEDEVTTLNLKKYLEKVSV